MTRSEKGDGTTSRSKVRIDLGESEEYTYDDQNENPGKSTGTQTRRTSRYHDQGETTSAETQTKKQKKI